MFSVSLLIGYLIWFPFAYTLQVKFVFNTKWDFSRLGGYALTQVANLFINLFASRSLRESRNYEYGHEIYGHMADRLGLSYVVE